MEQASLPETLTENVAKALRQVPIEQHANRPNLINALVDLASRYGLNGLVRKFEEQGLERQVRSWISTTENLPISGTDVERGLGREDVQTLADQAGVPHQKATEWLTGLLPVLIDRLTPEGKIPEQGILAHTLRLLRKHVL
jgi:uncharacterized protein YidB (DUF937 family)